MTCFIGEAFLLQNPVAEQLYFDFAEPLPIIDYHNHLPPQDVAQNRQFDNLTQAWLEDDHYKWRAMRAMGIDESYCTGSQSDQAKFLKWASIVPHTLGNPLYHWSHMELNNPFGISELLNEDNALSVYQRVNEQLNSNQFSCQQLLLKRNVEVICTTDNPTDDLAFHRQFSQTKGRGFNMLPTFRIDPLLVPANSNQYRLTLESLGRSSDIEITCLTSLKSAIQQRMEFFHQQGCRLSDVGLSGFDFVLTGKQALNQTVQRLLIQQPISESSRHALNSAILLFIAECAEQLGWVQQLHMGALRDANSHTVTKYGQGRGFDSIGSYNHTLALNRFFDHLAKNKCLTKSIIYNLNPADNAVFSTLAGTYNEGDIRGKVQHGAAWWFLDQKQGIEQHLDSVSSLGLLSCFVGMLTDSRSFLSFSRHEYFRRLLCNYLGTQVEQGLLPRDVNLLGSMVQNICYYNAKTYFPFSD